jgi:hypothetical protein
VDARPGWHGWRRRWLLRGSWGRAGPRPERRGGAPATAVRGPEPAHRGQEGIWAPGVPAPVPRRHAAPPAGRGGHQPGRHRGRRHLGRAGGADGIQRRHRAAPGGQGEGEPQGARSDDEDRRPAQHHRQPGPTARARPAAPLRDRGCAYHRGHHHRHPAAHLPDHRARPGPWPITWNSCDRHGAYLSPLGARGLPIGLRPLHRDRRRPGGACGPGPQAAGVLGRSRPAAEVAPFTVRRLERLYRVGLFHADPQGAKARV